MATAFPRDLVGSGGTPPHPHWPGEARIAVNFVMNYEEGSEYNAQDDGFSEATLTEAGASNYGGKGRDLGAEGLVEDGRPVVNQYDRPEADEREHIRKAVESMKKTVGERPLGWYCRYGPSVNTRRLVVEGGGFLYDSDAYNEQV